MKTIIRKTMLYVTGVEYGDFTMNHVLGCAHGCRYPCYAYLMKKRFKQVSSYEDWCEPQLVSNTLELLDQEIPRLKTRIKSVQLCFSTDPFMYGYEEVAKMSIAAIKKLNTAGIKCTILTKGVLPIELAELSRENEYGITLVALDDEFRRRFEPGSAMYNDRINALRMSSELGCKTWVSVEPYPTPNLHKQDIQCLLNSIAFADKIIFGRMNYNKIVSEYDDVRGFYNEHASQVIEFCKQRHISYHIKDGTITHQG